MLTYGEGFGGAAKNFFRLIRDVDSSHFDYIALSDQDDIWDGDKLHHAIKTIEQDDLDGYSSDVIAFWDNGKEELVKKSFPQKKLDYFFEAAGPGSTYVLKQQSVQKFKIFLIKNWGRVNLIQATIENRLQPSGNVGCEPNAPFVANWEALWPIIIEGL